MLGGTGNFLTSMFLRNVIKECKCFHIDNLFNRYSVEQFITKNKDVVSFLNITSVSSEDGGLYTCKAVNSLGEVSHTSRLNIYGKTNSVRTYCEIKYLILLNYRDPATPSKKSAC